MWSPRDATLAQESYPQVALLKQIKGVGTLIGLTFLLTLDPHRFAKTGTWAAIWAYSRDAETRDRGNRTFWVSSVWTAICAAAV